MVTRVQKLVAVLAGFVRSLPNGEGSGVDAGQDEREDDEKLLVHSLKENFD